METYARGVVPDECHRGSFSYQGTSYHDMNRPVILYYVYKNYHQGGDYSAYKYFSDLYDKPILVTDYEAGDIFTVSVKIWYVGSSVRDYSLTLYTK